MPESSDSIRNNINPSDLFEVLDSFKQPLFLIKPVFDNSGEIEDFEFVFLNSSAACLINKNKEKTIGEKLLQLFLGVKENLFDIYLKVFKTNEPETSEKHYDSDGLNLYFSITVSKTSNYLLLALEDITSQKQNEIKFLEQSKVIKRLQHLSKTGYYISINQNFSCTKEMYHIYEVPFHFDFREFLSLVHPDDLKKCQKLAESIRTQNGVHKDEYRIVTQSGKTKWIYVESITELGFEDKSLKVEGFVQDITERKQFEAKLFEKNKLINKISTTFPDVICIYDTVKGTRSYVNKSLSELLGYAKGEIDNNAEIEKLFHQDDVLKVEVNLSKVLEAKDGEVIESIFRVMDKFGNLRWINSRCTVYKRNSKGSVIQVLTTISDITETQNYKEALIETNESLLDAQTLANMGNWIFNPVTKKSIWSDQTYTLFGEPKKEIENVYEILEKWVFPEDLKKLKYKVEEAIKNEGSFQIIYRIIRADGEFRVISSRANAFRSNDGEILLKGVCQDITERWLAEKEIRKNEEVMAYAEEMANLGSWEWNIETNKVFWTNQLYEILGHTPKTIKVSNYTYFNHVHPDDKNIVMGSIRQALEGTGAFHNEYRIIRKDGEERYVTSSGKVKRNNEGVAVSMFGICMDITEKRNAAIEAKEKAVAVETEKLLSMKKDEFISIASHELKTPLTSLKAYLQLLDETISEEMDVEKNYINKTHKYIQRLERLISDLLDVSKIESGKMRIDLKEFEFSELLQECIENIKPMHQHSILFNNLANKAKIRGDKQRLEQVVSNIISNAAKYSPGGDKIDVIAEMVKGKIVVKVKDYGIGIKKEVSEKIFQKFYRVENVNSSAKGLGIGLYISSEFIKQHGGKIWVESEFGKGSQFCFSLPVWKKSKEAWIKKRAGVSD